MVGIALGLAPVDRCPALDQLPEIHDLVRGVESALFGCSGPIIYRLLDGSTLTVASVGGARPTMQPLRGTFAVISSESRIPNTFFELTIVAIDFRTEDDNVAVGAGANAHGCHGTAGLGCLSASTFDFDDFSLFMRARIDASIDGVAVALNGRGPMADRGAGFFDLVLYGSAEANQAVSGEATGGGTGPEYTLKLVASRGRLAD